MQNTFYENSTILNTYPRIWIVDRFFIETLGIPYATLAEVIADRWIGDSAPPFDDLEQDIAQVYNFPHFNAPSPLTNERQLMISHVRGLWFNPPRHRRHLMMSVLNWHLLYDALLDIMSNVDANVILRAVAPVILSDLMASLRLSLLWLMFCVASRPSPSSGDFRPFAMWYYLVFSWSFTLLRKNASRIGMLLEL